MHPDPAPATPPRKRRGKSTSRRRRIIRQLLAELLEPRCLLSAEGASSLVFSGIAPLTGNSTNPGLVLVADVASGLVAPLHAPFSSTSDRANGWSLPRDAGFSGLAFGPGGNVLLGAASLPGRSASNLLTMDPYTGVQRAAPVAIRAGNQALHISDLATLPETSYQLYGLGTPASTPNAPFQLYAIDPGSGQAVAVPDQPAWLTSLSTADALAFGPDGTIYVSGVESPGNAQVLYVQHSDDVTPLVSRYALSERVVGMDTRITWDASEAVQVELLTSTADGHWKWFDPVSGQLSATTPELKPPLRGFAGDIAFHPDPGSLTLQQEHHADFDAGTNEYTADNDIHAMPGMWHPSPGRHADGLINHTYGHVGKSGSNWYYGQFETATGGGTYLTTYAHGGILSSPPIKIPECATTALSFSYLLDVRQPLDVDFVEVLIQEVDRDGVPVQRTRVLSRAEGTLPQTGNRWLTATTDLTPFAGKNVQIQFLFDTGGVPDIDPEGWYVDDVVVASMPKAICGFKWRDLDYDGQWDPGEPGLNGWPIHAVPEKPFEGRLDANAFSSGEHVGHPDDQAPDDQVKLEVSATGQPIWAMPDPREPSRNVLAWGSKTGEEVWSIDQMLRATFPKAVHTVSLDVAQADATGPTRIVLQAFDQHHNRIAEQVRTLASTQWQTLTVSVTGEEIAYVKASVDVGFARFNDLRYWGTAPASEDARIFVTQNNGRHDGAFWFDRLPPGEYIIREELPEGWVQSYPGPPDFAHRVTVTAGQSVIGHWEATEEPNFGNFKPDIFGYKWHDVNYNGYWDKDEHIGLNGWQIELHHDINGNGVLDPGEPLIDWTTTQWNGQRHGAFSFVNVAPGDYILREVLPDLWRQTYPGAPTFSHSIRVIEGQPIVGRWQETERPNFGNSEIAVITGAKWEDRNADGMRDDGDLGLVGWVIQAYRDTNGNGQLDSAEAMLGPADSALTKSHGDYVLIVDPGNYIIVEMLRDGWKQSFPQTPVLAPDLDPAVWRFGEYGYAVSVAGGRIYDGHDFGNYQEVDLALTKTESVDPVIAGSGAGNLTYVVTVANLGPADASGVVISEVLTLPDGVTIDGITVSRGTLAGESPDYTWNVGDLRAGENGQLTVTLTVAACAADGAVISNTATVTQVDQPDSNPDNNTVREDTTVRRLADLKVTKSESVDPVVAGSGPENLVYVVTVTNLGPSDASGVTLSEVLSLPECVTVDSMVRSRGNLTGAAADYVWELGDLRAGKSEHLTVTLTVAACAADGALIENTAAVLHANEPDPDPDNNTAREDTTVRRQVTLETTKTGSPDRVIAGSGPGNLTYTVTVRNLGPSDASGVEIGEILTLPPCVTVDQPIPDPSRGVIHGTPPEFTWSIGELSPGEETQWTMTLTVAACAPHGGTIVNTATVRVNETPGGEDPPPVVTPIDTLADLEIISKTDTPDPVRAGEELTYEIHFRNRGPSDAQQVTVTDVLPAHTRFFSAVIPQGWQIAEPPSGEHGDVVFSKGAVSPDETATFQIVVLVSPETSDGTILVNTATADSETDDPDLENNSKTATTKVKVIVPPLEIPRQVVQFITPMSVYRANGPFEFRDDSNGQVSIQGYLWHDLNQNGEWDNDEPGRAGWRVYLDLNGDGEWDPGEPFVITDTDGRYVFKGLDPGTYTVRIARLGLSDGTFRIMTFPGPGGHVVEVKDGEPVVGAEKQTGEPNLGSFDYSPFIRPADDHFCRLYPAPPVLRKTMLDALEPWQSFTITNTTESPFHIGIEKNIEPMKQWERIGEALVETEVDATQFVAVYHRVSETILEPVTPSDARWCEPDAEIYPPIEVPSGQTIQFFVFYDPTIREGDQVIAQYPDWYEANKHTHPAHTFTRDDHLSVSTGSGLVFRIDLVGGSTYDSDIFYDGAVDRLDLERLSNDLLDIEWPIREGVSWRFDPSSDINARCPNGAEAVLNTCAWPLDGVPGREIGLGDFGPLNVEWNRARAPFLDLDPDNSSGAKGVDYLTSFQGEKPVPIADSDARFANRDVRALQQISFQIINPSVPDRDRLNIEKLELLPGIEVIGNGTHHLILKGIASVDLYTTGLRLVSFQSASLSPRIVEVEVQAKGSTSVGPNFSFTKLGDENQDDWELMGNRAIARIVVAPPRPTDVAPVAGFDAMTEAESESEGARQTSYLAVPASIATVAAEENDLASGDSSFPSDDWESREHLHRMTGDGVFAPLDAFLTVNAPDTTPASPSVAFDIDGEQPHSDVNGDSNGTSQDALRVMNQLPAEQLATSENDEATMLAGPALVGGLFDGADAKIRLFGMPPHDSTSRTAFDPDGDFEYTNDWLEPLASADASMSVPPTAGTDALPPFPPKTSSAEDDDVAVLDGGMLDVEGLLADLVEDLAAVRLR